MQGQPGGQSDALDVKNEEVEDGSEVEVVHDQPSCKKRKIEGSTGGGSAAAMYDHDQEAEQSTLDGALSDLNNEEPQPQPQPEMFRRRIESMGGTNPVLVMEKRLSASDMSRTQNRLLIPPSAVKNEFLTDEEKALLDREGKVNKIDTRVLDTKGLVWTIPIKRWLVRGIRKAVLTNPWIDLAKDRNNMLSVGDEIQLWAFRVDGRLCFALVKTEDEH